MEDKEPIIEIKIRQLRKMHSLSQEELADALGVSRQSIISLEQGKSMPSLPLAVSFCRFFNSAFEDVFEFEKEMNDEIDKRINNKVIKLNDSDQIESGKETKMVELEPWRPFREAVSLRDAMDRLFEDSIITPVKTGGMPKVDIIDKKDSIVIKAELPGIKEDDVNIEILDNSMTISGEKKEEKEEEKNGYYYKESHTGTFTRTFNLPADVMADKAEAEMKDGILTVTVPKIEPKKAQKIKIATKK